MSLFTTANLIKAMNNFDDYGPGKRCWSLLAIFICRILNLHFFLFAFATSLHRHFAYVDIRRILQQTITRNVPQVFLMFTIVGLLAMNIGRSFSDDKAAVDTDEKIEIKEELS